MHRESRGISNSPPNSSDLRFIDIDLIHHVQYAYSKIRQTETYKVHKRLKSKIDDFTTASTSLATNLNLSLRSTATPDSGSVHHGAASTSGSGHGIGNTTPALARSDTLLDSDITDIEALVKVVNSGVKSDIPSSMRDLWGGRPGHHRHLREHEEANRLAAMASLSARYPLGLGGLWDDNEDNSYAGLIWRGAGARVQRKGQALAHGIAGWTGSVTFCSYLQEERYK